MWRLRLEEKQSVDEHEHHQHQHQHHHQQQQRPITSRLSDVDNERFSRRHLSLGAADRLMTQHLQLTDCLPRLFSRLVASYSRSPLLVTLDLPFSSSSSSCDSHHVSADDEVDWYTHHINWQNDRYFLQCVQCPLNYLPSFLGVPTFYRPYRKLIC